MSKKVVRLTESDLKRIIKRVIKEQIDGNKPVECIKKVLEKSGVTGDIEKIATCLTATDISNPNPLNCLQGVSLDIGKSISIMTEIGKCLHGSTPDGAMSLTKNTDIPTPQSNEELGA